MPEVLSTPSTRKGQAREAKFNLKNYTGWNANSYINTLISGLSGSGSNCKKDMHHTPQIFKTEASPSDAV